MIRILLGLMLMLTIPLQSVFAQSDTTTFSISVFGGPDITPPTTPTLLTAVPVAPTQVDITWSASTDNYAVTGYSVLRDGTPVATTTLLSYSDTGLAASTTYSYIVRAFDAALNYSSSSNSLSTTTPDTPPPVATTTASSSSSSEGTIAKVVLDELNILPGVSTSSFKLKTAATARVELRWGRTASYEIGYVTSDAYAKDHSILLTDLEPGTTYEYQLIGYTPYGKQVIIKSGQFTTLGDVQIVQPANVARFQAIASHSDAVLSWQLPAADNVDYVRIVRSHLGFPEHLQDGAIVYQGLKTSVVDTGILSVYSPVYYTAFVVDKNGNVSSGAVALVYAGSEITNNQPTEGGQWGIKPPVQKTEIITEATSSVVSERVTAEMKMPESAQIIISQNSDLYTMQQSDISLLSSKPFQISIAKEHISGNLKSIIVTLLDPTDNRQKYSFLLRINKQKTAYEAVVAPLLVVGKSRLTVEIYDYEAEVVATYHAPINFVQETVMVKPVVFPDAIMVRSDVVLYVFLFFLLLFLIIFFFYRRRDEDKE